MAAAPDLSQIPPSDIPDALQDGIAVIFLMLCRHYALCGLMRNIHHMLGWAMIGSMLPGSISFAQGHEERYSDWTGGRTYQEQRVARSI